MLHIIHHASAAVGSSVLTFDPYDNPLKKFCYFLSLNTKTRLELRSCVFVYVIFYILVGFLGFPVFSFDIWGIVVVDFFVICFLFSLVSCFVS